MGEMFDHLVARFMRLFFNLRPISLIHLTVKKYSYRSRRIISMQKEVRYGLLYPKVKLPNALVLPTTISAD
jgi:hypothetical protein